MPPKRIRAVGVVLHEGKILLMFRRKDGREYYVFPGGGVEEGETNEEAVVRELREETSVDVSVGRLLYHHIYDDGSERFYYLCKYLGGEPRLEEGSSEQRKMTEENFYEPRWVMLVILSEFLVYPLEVRDDILQDMRIEFGGTPRKSYLVFANLRQTL